jgi:hypothetical protein
MIEILKDVPDGVVAVRASGTLTREEYDEVVVPLLDEARRARRRLRCLCEVGADYRGLTPGAAWEDVTLGLRSLHLFDGCAVVSDVGWVRGTSRCRRGNSSQPGVFTTCGDRRGGSPFPVPASVVRLCRTLVLLPTESLLHRCWVEDHPTRLVSPRARPGVNTAS